MLDLDGTTIPNRRDGLPSQKVTEAILKVNNRIHVCTATSRPLVQALPIIQQLKLSSPCIVDGGAQIYDPVSKKILSEQPIESADIKTIFDFVNKNNIEFKYSIGSDEVGGNAATIFKEKVFGFYLRCSTEKQADQIISSLSHKQNLSFHKILSWNTGTFGIKISHIIATKQYGILEVAKLLKIETHEIIGVGDGYNDFPLLMACGLKVAMGNAVDDLKAIADYIAPTVENDGVVDVIEKFVRT